MRNRKIEHCCTDEPPSIIRQRCSVFFWDTLLRASIFKSKNSSLRLRFRVSLALSVAIFTGMIGCCPATPAVPTTQSIRNAVRSGLQPPVVDDKLKAIVVPPVGWKPEPVKFSPKHRHQIWISPSGNTAYGVIYFSLPFPVGTSLALDGFIRQMRSTEGTATLLSQKDDDRLGGIRFVADGAFYTVHGNLTTDGFHGWVVYAATVRAKPVNTAELKTAELAREQTRVDLP
jgi:hypothetical protein